MNLLDILLVIMLGYGLLRGIFRGLVKELSAIIGVLGGVYAAYTYYPLLADILSRWISKQGYLNILSCLVLFFVVFFIISVAGTMIKYFLNIVFLGWTDRLGGAFFGAIKGGLIAATMVLVLTTFLPPNTALLRESRVARQSMKIGSALARMASGNMKNLFGSKINALGQTGRVTKR